MHGTFERYSATETSQSVTRLEGLARLTDGAFVLPGTNIRVGLDVIVGLVPVAGDVISGLISSYVIWEARQLGAPKWLIARMMANTLLERYRCRPVRLRHRALQRQDHPRNFAMISSGLCRLPIVVLQLAEKAIPQLGPLRRRHLTCTAHAKRFASSPGSL
jgi:hypothetical protein